MVFEVKGKLKKNGGAEPLGVKKTTNKKIDPHMTSLTGFELRLQRWEASALMSTPSLHSSTKACE